MRQFPIGKEHVTSVNERDIAVHLDLRSASISSLISPFLGEVLRKTSPEKLTYCFLPSRQSDDRGQIRVFFVQSPAIAAGS
ncbi:MAG: hypothetical protein IPJ30_23440 [Acidobacteria bacterium]|nr:hypothetical protein [Acidobacteriota bacterium]